MAKAKTHSKKEAVSPFVPVEEQPYEVPENWLWVRGGDLLASMETQKPTGTEFEYIDIDAIDNQKQVVTAPKRILVSEAPSRASRKLHTGDTLFSMVRPYLKNIAYIDESLSHCIASTGFFVCTLKSILNSHYLYRLMISPYMVDGLNQYMKGDNSPSIRKDDIEEFPFPIPPLPEQQRIVDLIEGLFAKLDEAKEKAQAVVDGFEMRKSAILHKAFTGELTAQWRKEHGVGMESWKHHNLQSVCAMKITDGTHKTPTYCDAGDGIPFISAKDITVGSICWDKIKYIIPELHEALYARLAPQVDDILLAKNGTTGIAAIVEEEKIFDIYVTLAVLRPDKSIVLPRYLLNIVNSPVCKRQFDEHLTGIGVPNLHLRDIKAVIIPVPQIMEQMEIIRIIDCILRQEQQAKEAAEAVLDQIDTMKKAILVCAFRGELGTNNPDEESVAELLKKTLNDN